MDYQLPGMAQDNYLSTGFNDMKPSLFCLTHDFTHGRLFVYVVFGSANNATVCGVSLEYLIRPCAHASFLRAI